MPARDGEFYKLTKTDIQDNLETALEEKLDTTSEPGDLVTKQLESEAEVLVENQEAALERIYYASYLEDATDRELEKVVDLIGLSRLEATSATGTVKLMRDTPPGTTYTIPQGTTVQTQGESPIQFSLTEQTALPYIDGWETGDLSKWVGDTGSFNVASTTEMTNDYALEVPATDNVQISVSNGSYGVGTTFDYDLRPNSGAVTEIRFGYQDDSNYHRAIVDSATDELKLETVEDGSSVGTRTETVTIPTGATSHVEIEWSLYGDNALKLYDSETKDTLIGSVFLDQPVLWPEGNVAIRSGDATATALVDELSGTAVTANVEAQGDGLDTNIGPHQIKVVASSVSGVEDVTNEVATGDSTYQDTNMVAFKTGADRESDEELRDRAFENTSIGGAATRNAIETEIARVEGFQSMTVYQNKTEDVKDGLPPHSFEVVVYGGSDEDIAEVLFYTESIDSQDVGGIHGSSASYDITSDVSGDVETMSWSRPGIVDVDITLDLIVDDTFIGKEEIQTKIVEHIGGTDIDGSFVPGIDVGEDIYIAVLKQKIVDPEETGVWEVDSISFSNNTIDTLGNGAEVISIADSNVAEANARDGSITVNTTLK